MKNSALLMLMIAGLSTQAKAAALAYDNPVCVKVATEAVQNAQPSADVSEPEAGGLTPATKDRADMLTLSANVEGDYYYVYVVTLTKIEGDQCKVQNIELVDSGY